jgi:hypothetical protein
MKKHPPLNIFVILNKSEFTSTFHAKHAVQVFDLKQTKEDTKKCISLGGKHHLVPKQILRSIFTPPQNKLKFQTIVRAIL